MSAETFNYQGFAWDLAGGFDYWVWKGFAVTPWLGLSLGTYTKAKNLQAPDSGWKTISSTSLHTLIIGGVRASWEFGASPRS